MSIEDLESEKAVLAGIIKYGQDAYSDVSLWVGAVDFMDDYNQLIYQCVKKHFDDGEERPIDPQTLNSLIQACKFERDLGKEDALRHIRAIYNTPIELSTVEPEAQKLFKLGVRRQLSLIARRADKELHNLTGAETLAAIFSIVEDPLNSYISGLGGGEFDGPKRLGKGGRERYLKRLETPNHFTGIPTKFPTYNKWIGGGFRPGTVSLIGARLKTGKTLLGMDIGIHTAEVLGFPVLFIDTEMGDEEHENRAWANLSGVEISKIELATTDEEETERVLEAADRFEAMPYDYESVQTKTFEERCASMKRWCSKNVKYDDEGKANPVLVIYDYLNLADPSEMAKELSTSENMGVNMLALMKIAGRFKIPILSFVQLSRDGEDMDSSRGIAMSDLPARSAANIALFKKIDDNEVEENGIPNGTRYLTVPDARHGSGSQGDRLTMIFEGNICRISEGPPRSEIRRGRGTKPSNEKKFERKSKRKIQPLEPEVDAQANVEPPPRAF